MKQNKIINFFYKLKNILFKSKKRTIITILVLIVMIYTIFIFVKLLKNPTNIFLVESGSIYLEETSTGYIIRNEEIIEGKNLGTQLIQIKNEGEKVGKNEAIFRYASNTEQNLNDKIKELDVKIQEALKNETTIFSSDIKLLDNQIEVELNDVYETNELQKINEHKKNINTYITKKAKIAGDLSKSGSYIKDLINTRSEYERQLNNSSEYIKSTKSGIVSYKVDGLESVLTTTNFDYLSTEFLENLNLKTSQIIASSDEKGKIIDNFKCYLACTLTSTEAVQAQVGDSLKLRLPNSKEISTKIAYKKVENDDKILLIFEVENEVQELIRYRKITFDVIWWSDSGLKVPIDAINYEGDLTYIVRNKAGYEEKVYVKVVKNNNKYAIVENYSNEELEAQGYDLNNLSGKKSISLYDELKIVKKEE